MVVKSSFFLALNVDMHGINLKVFMSICIARLIPFPELNWIVSVNQCVFKYLQSIRFAILF